jgi:transketolase
MVNIAELSIKTIRSLAIDAIEKANSGHPGMPMGTAPMAYTLWTKFMNQNPSNPSWFNRDRFVLSAGHGSMLLYSLLHLSGFEVTLDDLKQFRQWGSKTPGHPEYGHTPGVEATTGPLGQGFAMAVGMAMAERHLAAKYNKEKFNVVDHYTYSICGDGDLMEGVSSEAASLAGHLKLGRLIVLYDSNDISLDGDLNLSFSEDVQKRFEALGWQYIQVNDGNRVSEIEQALQVAKEDEGRPTIIEVKTVIGYGSPNKSGKSDSHGSPLGKAETALTKHFYEWPYKDEFYVPEEVYDHFKETILQAGADKEKAWNKEFEEYKRCYPHLAAELEAAIEGKLPDKWETALPIFDYEKDPLATRASSGHVLNEISKVIPQLFGGSADLAGSNNTRMKEEKDFSSFNFSGRNIWFGVREFAMGCLLNGMALHGGLKVYGGTFFVFSDYVRPAIRLSALMKLPVTYVFTHDSIAVGEDGPTHEPIEQLAALRAMPELSIIRPGDGNETTAAWKLALESHDKPTVLVLTRQAVPTFAVSKDRIFNGVEKGAYVLSEAANKKPMGLLLASGSEVSLAIEAQKELENNGVFVSVISMPSWDRFEKQSKEYKESVLPKNVKKRLAIEMASTLGWERYTGDEGEIIGIDRFGASAPGNKIMTEYGFTVETIVSKVMNMVREKSAEVRC